VNALDEVVADLIRIDVQLRDLALERLQRASSGDESAEDDERKLAKARRAVSKAIRDLGAEPETEWTA